MRHRTLFAVAAAVVAALLAAVPPVAAQQPISDRLAYLAMRYDVTATSYTYPRLTGAGSVFDSPIIGPAEIETSGSSTTVTEVTASSAPFASVAVGDILYVQPAANAPVTIRRVATRASSASITVDAAVNWSGGFPFGYRKFATGTGASDGWIYVSRTTAATKAVQISVETINATSIDYSIEGRIAPDLPAAVLLTGTFSAVGGDVFPIPEAVQQIRVGLKVTGDAGAQSVSVAYVER